MDKQVILCVDDEKIILDSLFTLLLDEFDHGYDVELAETGEEAIEIFDDCRDRGIMVPLVIADYIMPGMKGDELLIRLHERNASTLKILLTGQATIEGVVHAFEQARLYRYIEKPWERNDFIVTIREALKSYQAERNRENLLHEKVALLEQVRSAERKYRAIFENAVEGIFQANPGGEIIAANPALEELLGFVPGAAPKLRSLKRDAFCDPGDWDRFVALLEEKRVLSEYTTTFCKKGKKNIWVAIYARLIDDPAGENRLIDGCIQDITEKKKAQAELVHYQKHLEELVAARTRELQQANTELKAALGQVKLLSGFLPICAQCKNIRNDAGYWEKVESYLKEHSGVEFSHSICPDCQQKL